MRFVGLTLLIVLLGTGIWALLGGFDKPPAADPAPADAEGETAEEAAARERLMARFGRKTGTLGIEVRIADGTKPMMAEVGYLQPNGKPRWLTAQNGRRVITDAPLGSLQVVARAPGYDRAEQGCELVQGVRADVIVILGLARSGDADRTPKDQ